eukprot:scaffold2679_cov251-Pinguiococcus_pyrenoidosus.AAC.21
MAEASDNASESTETVEEVELLDIRFHSTAPHMRLKAMNVRPSRVSYAIGGPLQKPWASVSESYQVGTQSACEA